MRLPTPFRHPANALPTGVSDALPTGADALPTGCVPTPLIPPHPSEADGSEGFCLRKTLFAEPHYWRADVTDRATIKAVTSPDDVVLSIAQQLDDLAKQTGAARLHYAARVVRGDAAGGRHPVDDREALSKVAGLIARGRTEWQARNIVARKIQPRNPRAAVRRLGDKLKKQGR